MKKAERDIVTAMIQINSLSSYGVNISREHSALVVLPGADGHEYRITEAVKYWKRGVASYLMIAGRRETPPLSEDYIKELIKPNMDMGRFLFQEQAANTLEQVEWALDKLPVVVHHLILSTAAYHLPRGFLTLLCSMRKRNMDRRIILSAVPTINPENPAVDFVGFDYTGGTGILGEMERIQTYQESGYDSVASVESYIDYLKWRQNMLGGIG